MQAIETKYLCPTNTQGSRIKAKCQAGSITIVYPSELDIADAHLKAAYSLCGKLSWGGELKGGELPNGNMAFVFI